MMKKILIVFVCVVVGCLSVIWMICPLATKCIILGKWGDGISTMLINHSIGTNFSKLSYAGGGFIDNFPDYTMVCTMKMDSEDVSAIKHLMEKSDKFHKIGQDCFIFSIVDIEESGFSYCENVSVDTKSQTVKIEYSKF